jgi:hypothetical protein
LDWPLTGRVFPVCYNETNAKDILAAGPLTHVSGRAFRIILMKEGETHIVVAKEVFPNWPETNPSEFEDEERFPLVHMQKAIIAFGEAVGNNSYMFRASA